MNKAERLKRKSGVAVCAIERATRHKKIFHLSDKLLLLATWQVGGGFKKLSHLAGWS